MQAFAESSARWDKVAGTDDGRPDQEADPESQVGAGLPSLPQTVQANPCFCWTTAIPSAVMALISIRLIEIRAEKPRSSRLRGCENHERAY
jgi:hypothetical protein